MSNESQYLNEVAKVLERYADQLAEIEQDHGVSKEEILLIERAIKEEADLRERYALGARFSIIANQLNSLRDGAILHINNRENHNHIRDDFEGVKIGEDERRVYVYLFNAQGSVLSSWGKLLARRALLDHSINRPIYTELNDIEELLRTKKELANHGYLEVIIKNEHILSDSKSFAFRDALDHPLLRLKQGALKSEKIVRFVLEEKCYQVTEEGHLLPLSC